MSGQWQKRKLGVYEKRDGGALAVVKLEEELWRTQVFYADRLVDCGEWDSRHVAFGNAESALRRARNLRSPLEQADEISKRVNEEACDDDS